MAGKPFRGENAIYHLAVGHQGSKEDETVTVWDWKIEIKYDLLLNQCAWPCLWAAISSGCELLQGAQVGRTQQ